MRVVFNFYILFQREMRVVAGSWTKMTKPMLYQSRLPEIGLRRPPSFRKKGKKVIMGSSWWYVGLQIDVIILHVSPSVAVARLISHHPITDLQSTLIKWTGNTRKIMGKTRATCVSEKKRQFSSQWRYCYRWRVFDVRLSIHSFNK